jgi:2-polyprenyl-3-methyl-5-hydroxy-6-metoxy-1,4-benzoquinol methylase
MKAEISESQGTTMADNNRLIKEAFEQPQWYLQGTAYNIKLRVETIVAFLGKDKFQAVLDIGCGDGSLSLPLLDANTRITFLDQSQAMLQLVRSRVPLELSSRVQTINSNFMTSQLEAQTFDLILCVGVLAYVEQRRDFIAKIKASLKPGGVLIIECTDGPHFVNRLVVAYHALRRAFRPAKMKTVVRSSAELISICEDLGFVRCASYRYSLPLPVLRKLMSQSFSYRAIRFIFGAATRNRNAWLGNECIYRFKLR